MTSLVVGARVLAVSLTKDRRHEMLAAAHKNRRNRDGFHRLGVGVHIVMLERNRPLTVQQILGLLMLRAKPLVAPTVLGRANVQQAIATSISHGLRCLRRLNGVNVPVAITSDVAVILPRSRRHRVWRDGHAMIVDAREPSVAAFIMTNAERRTQRARTTCEITIAPLRNGGTSMLAPYHEYLTSIRAIAASSAQGESDA